MFFLIYAMFQIIFLPFRILFEIIEHLSHAQHRAHRRKAHR